MSKPRLLVSVFNAEEVRAAVAGGADIIDCEDPRADVGMFEPRIITDIAYAVRQTEGVRTLPTSANIGFNLELFERAKTNLSTRRSQLEIQAKAAQEVLGVAAAMDVGDARPNIIKFGVEGIKQDDVVPLVKAVKSAIRNSRKYQNHKLVGSLLAIDFAEWEKRRTDKRIIGALLRIDQYYFAEGGSIDLKDYFSAEEVAKMIAGRSSHSRVELIEPFTPLELQMPEDPKERLRSYVDLITAAGADAVMIDTPLQAKAARICLLDTEENASDDGGGTTLPRGGIFKLEVLELFADYCAYSGAEAWLAGSIQPYQARKLSAIKSLDVVLCRDSASAVVKNPFGGSGTDERSARRISEEKVALMAKAVHEGT
jgi:uncharacterized protein (UPF0264 family)